MARPFAVFDIDGTLVRWQLYHAIADQLVKLGYIDASAFTAIRDARMIWKRREHAESFKDYEVLLIKLYDEVMQKITPAQFDEAIVNVFNEYKDQVYAYTRALIAELKDKNYLLFAISGSQVEIVAMIAKYYGFDDYVGSKYVRRGDKFSGEVIAPLGKKHLILKQLAVKHKATWRGSVAVGDSQGDIKMLESVEKPIAFNPERALFKKAKAQGWLIALERKNMIYELEKRGGSYVLA
jgi:HAD superfamily phosphoserine phosphatase-like hydrolase